jgi:hypothetical protein
MLEYFGDGWKNILSTHSLANFEQIWTLKSDWFEEPNIRRGGWSGVIKYPLQHDKTTVNVFIKRQENHASKTLLHPIKGMATFKKEFHNIKRLTDKKIPTLELIYFGSQNLKAILITKSLENFYSLESVDRSLLTTKERHALLSAIATATQKMHQHHFQHNCFYPKHIFVQKLDEQWDVKFIDLEKLKRTPFKKHATERDLFTLYRHSDFNWTIKDRIYFFKAYVNEGKLSKKSKKLWYAIEKKLQAKRKVS